MLLTTDPAGNLAGSVYWPFQKKEARREMLGGRFVGGVLTAAVAAASWPAMASDFQAWLDDLRKEAFAKGISPVTVEQTLTKLEPIPRVIELDRSQPEFTLTFRDYMDRVVTPTRVENARARYDEHKALLTEVARKHGVQPRFIVALWGIESDFGRLTGGFGVIPALATLAHDGRRSRYFRGELLNALQIIDQGHIGAAGMRGSWAGAMGQVQFMPSSFLRFAIDFDGDGRKDLWKTLPDVFASAANYLAGSGWNGDQTWGRRVTVPAGLDASLFNKNVRKSLKEWQELGVRRSSGADLPQVDIAASLVRPTEGKTVGDEPAFLVYGNYEAILKWNRSHFFALAVGHLADAIVQR